jgi:antitoxin (DNA-binding transcriptional repressor) of toxin-antitoxin stability system
MALSFIVYQASNVGMPIGSAGPHVRLLGRFTDAGQAVAHSEMVSKGLEVRLGQCCMPEPERPIAWQKVSSESIRAPSEVDGWIERYVAWRTQLLQEVERGQEVVIARSGVPIARLVAWQAPAQPVAAPGAMRGQIALADDFDVPLDGLFEALQ